jgi:hypothetical protein
MALQIEETKLYFVRFDILTAVTMKNVVSWNGSLCSSCKNRRFGGTYRLHLQGENTEQTKNIVINYSQHATVISYC